MKLIIYNSTIVFKQLNMVLGKKGWDDIMTTNNSHEQAVQEIPQHGFFGHPRGLGVLFS